LPLFPTVTVTNAYVVPVTTNALLDVGDDVGELVGTPVMVGTAKIVSNRMEGENR